MIRAILICGFFLLSCFLPAESALQGPCEEELETYCSNIQPGEGRVVDCLKRYEDSLSAECKDYLKKSSDALKNLKQACADDAHEYCRDVKTSFRRIVACLKEHYNDITPDCRKMLKK